MKLMGWITIINSIWGLIVACIHIAEDRWIAQIYLPMMIPIFLLAYFYIQQFQADTVENRRRVCLGYKIYFITWIIMSCIFVGFVIWMPESYLPKDYVEIDGKKHAKTR